MKGKFTRTVTTSVTLTVISTKDFSVLATIKAEETPSTAKAEKEFLKANGLPADSKIIESGKEIEIREMDMDTFMAHSKPAETKGDN